MAENAARNRKMLDQPAKISKVLPSIGARIGATPMISINWENALAASIGAHRSRTTARLTTMPAQPPNA